MHTTNMYVLQLSLDGRFEKVDPGFCELLGRTEIELLGQHFTQLLSVEQREAEIARFQQIVKGEMPVAGSARTYAARHQQSVSFDVQSVLVRNSSGDPSFVLAIHADTLTRFADGTHEHEHAAVVYQLQERVKELTLLHQLARAMQVFDTSTEELCGHVLAMLPAAFQHPEHTGARIEFDDTELKTENYSPGEWQLESHLHAHDGSFGVLEVSYSGTVHNGESPFLPEEQELLDSVGELLVLNFNGRNARKAITDNEELMRVALQNAPAGFSVYDEQLRYRFINAYKAAFWGKHPDELTGRTHHEVFGDHHAPEFVRLLQAAADSNQRQNAELLLQGADSPLPSILVVAIVPMVLSSTGSTMIVCVAQDITKRRQAELALQRSEETYRRAISTAGAVPYQLNYETKRYVFVGEGIERVTGIPVDEFTSIAWRDMIEEVVVHGEAEGHSVEEAASLTRTGYFHSWRADMRIRTRSGETRWVADTSVELLDGEGKPQGSLGILQDITERKRAEEQLLHGAFHDHLTGLANRALLVDHLEQALYRARRRDRYHFAILFLDLDRFKSVNDSLGHLAGDQLLQEVARRLQASVRPGDVVARFAGDEFTILLDDVSQNEDVLQVAERIMIELRIPVLLGPSQVHTSASIGIVYSSPEYTGVEELLRDADAALYRAKARGKACYEVFTSTLRPSSSSPLQMENDLRAAMERDELLLHFQPIVGLKESNISAFETLLRWPHPTRGFIPPTQFIPLAEESHLINPLGYWVMRRALRQLKLWQTSGGREALCMSVNLSPRQFSQPDLARRLAEITEDEGVRPGSVMLEITESVLLERNPDVLETFRSLKEIGFHLVLDDFGAGYSSLGYLHDFPLDMVKIDRGFISRIKPEGRERALVQSILLLGRNLDLKVVAEGVETEEQLAILRDLGCELLQGYYFSKPVGAAEAGQLLANSPPVCGICDDA